MKKDIHNLFIEELKEIFGIEEQIVKGLPDLIKAADSPELKEAFKSHLDETKGQIKRLEKIFRSLDIKDKHRSSVAMKGLIEECQNVISTYEKSALRDAALISKVQCIEHFEISAYGTLRTFANELDFNDAAALLSETLDEESAADKKLTQIAEGGLLSTGINAQANE